MTMPLQTQNGNYHRVRTCLSLLLSLASAGSLSAGEDLATSVPQIATKETLPQQEDDISLIALPPSARLAFAEDWSSGRIDTDKWYVLRKKWGAGNHGVVPENVRIEEDLVDGQLKHVLVCEAHGDQYDGPVTGLWGKKTRVGGVIVSKPFFASGRFQVVMKIGSVNKSEPGPRNPRHPRGAVPAIWTFGYRFVKVSETRQNDFVPEEPLFNPHMPAYGIGANEYWSELDFPEFGKNGDYRRAMYNTFCQNRHESQEFDVGWAADGQYHTFTTEWRTELKPLEGVTDEQVTKHLGLFWINDKQVAFDRYLGNPLKRLSEDEYAVYQGAKATHWIDGKRVAENHRFIPAMAAQLNLGIWLPKWAGPAPWKRTRVRVASVKVWQYDDPGDVLGMMTESIKNNFDRDGRELP